MVARRSSATFQVLKILEKDSPSNKVHYFKSPEVYIPNLKMIKKVRPIFKQDLYSNEIEIGRPLFSKIHQMELSVI